MSSDLEKLVQLACSMGASDAKIIPSDAVAVEEELAERCADPRCENYGCSCSCPPHVAGPAGFRRIQESRRQAIAVRIAVPSAILFSAERREIFELLHDIVAATEQAAVKLGYSNSKGFAGGSCKQIFCHDQAECRVLSRKGACRHPHIARPSMSGFGIDVARLMKSCGWTAGRASRVADKEDGMSWVTGLIMIG